jgi:hypothetical protein
MSPSLQSTTTHPYKPRLAPRPHARLRKKYTRASPGGRAYVYGPVSPGWIAGMGTFEDSCDMPEVFLHLLLVAVESAHRVGGVLAHVGQQHLTAGVFLHPRRNVIYL